MATLTAPGVYVEELPSGVRPIEAAGTSTAAFFGEAERGPIGGVVRIFNFTEYQRHFGDFLTGGRFLAHAVYQFFKNGGASCYIGRIAPGATTASVTVLDRGAVPQDSLTFAASSPGAWGNRVMVRVSSGVAADPGNLFNLEVFRDNPEPDKPPELVETFADLSMDPGLPNWVQNAVNAGSTYIRAQVNLANSNQAQGFSESGIITVAGANLLGAQQRRFRININNDGFRTVDLTAALTGEDLTDPDVIAGAIEDVIQDMTPIRESTLPSTYTGASVTFTEDGGGPDGRLRITAGGAPGAASSVLVQDDVDVLTNPAGALRLGVNHGGTEVYGAANTRPQNTAADDFFFLGDDTVAGAVSAVVPGTNGSTPQPAHFIAALDQLDTIRDVSLIALPGNGDPGVMDAAMGYCMNRPLSDCFFIGDMNVLDDTFEDALTFRNTLNNPNSYGAVYFPYVLMVDPTGRSAEPIAVPPSGFIAGLYSRIDSRRGVWKAPAGTEALLTGAAGLVANVTDAQHGILNQRPFSVSVIRRFPGSGIVAWGARTVSTDSDHGYIPIRRMAIFLRVSIYNGIQWAVFEPNDEPLWASLRLNISSFMNTLFRKGAFQGATSSQAYFVKCDAETTTQADIDLGIVNVLVGFAPLKPAEFVIVKIRQIAGQTP
jgi:uncharacterized protein